MSLGGWIWFFSSPVTSQHVNDDDFRMHCVNGSTLQIHEGLLNLKSKYSRAIDLATVNTGFPSIGKSGTRHFVCGQGTVDSACSVCAVADWFVCM